jgi:hypothetical protein
MSTTSTLFHVVSNYVYFMTTSKLMCKERHFAQEQDYDDGGRA